MFNQLTIIGRLGADPEISTIPSSGKQVAKLSIATTHSYKNSQGNKQEETEWHKVVCFNGIAGVVQQYLHKGDQVLITGRLRTRKYQDQQGNDKYVTEVICQDLKMLGGRQQNQQPVQQNSAPQQPQAQQPAPQTYHAQAQQPQQQQEPMAYQQVKEPLF